MDYEELAKAAKEALELLPPSLVVPLIHLIFSHMQALFGLVPKLRALLEPHVKAAMVLKASGLLDMDELQAVLMPILQEYMSKAHVHGQKAG